MEIERNMGLEPAHAPESAPEGSATAACAAETAECTCPAFCERDHENDHRHGFPNPGAGQGRRTEEMRYRLFCLIVLALSVVLALSACGGKGGGY